MKTKFLPIALGLFCTTVAFGQKLEIGVQLNSGLSRFGGESAASTSRMYHMPQHGSAYTSNPYGNKVAAAYGISAQLQKVNTHNFIVGAQLGFESLKGAVKIDRVLVSENNTQRSEAANGTTTLRYDFLNLQPYFGRRFETGKFYYNLTIGADLGLLVNAREKSDVTYGQNQEIEFSRELGVMASNFDFRPRVGITSYYNNLGLSVSYAHGLTDHKPNLEGGVDQDAFFRVLRLGLIYKIK